MDRDFDKNPYSPEEQRVADYITRITMGMVGAGDDPIGFLISSHEYNANILRSLADDAD